MHGVSLYFSSAALFTPREESPESPSAFRAFKEVVNPGRLRPFPEDRVTRDSLHAPTRSISGASLCACHNWDLHIKPAMFPVISCGSTFCDPSDPSKLVLSIGPTRPWPEWPEWPKGSRSLCGGGANKTSKGQMAQISQMLAGDEIIHL